MTRSTDPSKNVFKKISPKFHCKDVQSNILLLNLNKNGGISILQSAHEHGNPTHTRALKQPRLSQNISPVCSSFVLVIASDMHLESQSEKRAKNVDLNTAKNIQIQLPLFNTVH